MKRLVYIMFIVLFAVILGACAKATTQPPGEMINPGDKVGDYLITKGEGEDIVYQWTLNTECVKQEAWRIYSCKLNIGTKLNLSWSVYASTSGKDLDTLWSEQTYKMFIDDHPVNLEAFGSIDIIHPRVGKMRYWNVVVVATEPGEIKIRCTGILGGDPSEGTITFTFNAP